MYLHGTVDNAAPELIGKTALLQRHENPDRILAQFDEMGRTYEGVDLSHGWHVFHRDAFILDEDRFESEDQA